MEIWEIIKYKKWYLIWEVGQLEIEVQGQKKIWVTDSIENYNNAARLRNHIYKTLRKNRKISFDFDFEVS